MGYSEAIEANGVKIAKFKEFGSYQGTWIAILEDGRYVEGSYGSCSGCDAFKAEFDWVNEPSEQDGKFYKTGQTWDEDDEIPESEFEQAKINYQKRMSDFGSGYLKNNETKDEIIARYTKKCEEEYAWEDDKEILDWLINN